MLRSKFSFRLVHFGSGLPSPGHGLSDSPLLEAAVGKVVETYILNIRRILSDAVRFSRVGRSAHTPIHI